MSTIPEPHEGRDDDDGIRTMARVGSPRKIAFNNAANDINSRYEADPNTLNAETVAMAGDYRDRTFRR